MRVLNCIQNGKNAIERFVSCMVRSMTGYGRAQEIICGRDITVELRSVNHRYFELNCRLPRSCGYLEDKLKTLLQGNVSRGKVEVGVYIQTLEGGPAEVEINTPLAASYLKALKGLSADLAVKDDISLSTLTRFSDIFVVHKTDEDEDEVWQQVKSVAVKAIEGFVAMRETEGKKLAEDLRARLTTIESLVGAVEEQSPRTTEDYRNRLYAKMTEVLGQTGIDEQRILTEAAIFAERTAVAEETVRLRSHISQFRKILQAPEPVGRKLDFLVQEFNREANTIGSKAQDIEISKIVVEIKSEIEKIREQIQNLE